MKKHLTFYMTAASLALSLSANAETYYFSPNGAGEQDGTSWENAAPAEYLPSTLANAEPGDCFYLMGGAYINKVDVVWTIPQGITLRGGYPTTSTGTSTDITYPSGYETIFSADIDGDGAGDNGTTVFISIDNTNADPDMTNFKKSVISGITVRDAHNTTTTKYKGSAVFTNNANVEFDHVKFVNNTTDIDGGICMFVGSRIFAHDCIWADNLGKRAGVAVALRQKGNTSTVGGGAGSELIIDRCEFTDNKVKEPTNSTSSTGATYGGALGFGDNCGTIYMANTTISGTDISWAGAAMRIGSNDVFYGINNTWFNCNCTWTTRHSGDILSCGTGSKIYLAGNIGVTTTDGRSGMMATHLIQSGTGSVVQAYYNVFGSLNCQVSDPVLDESNSISGDNIESVVFGTNTLGNNGGFSQTIAPKSDYCKVPLSDIQSLAESWNIPSEIDLTLDQRGYKRQSTTYVGSYDVNATTATAIETVNASADASLTVSALGEGLYRVAGAQGEARVYNLTGKVVSSATVGDAGIVDLSAAPQGIYILTVGGKSAKLVRF
jgi:hypothetical protein